MSAPGEVYKFRLRRDVSGGYVGELVDDWGWTISIRAGLVERDGVKVLKGAETRPVANWAPIEVSELSLTRLAFWQWTASARVSGPD